jgi:drug/metabolite transporter (DMT)-like permease
VRVPPTLALLCAGALFATGGSLIKLQTLPSLQRAGSRALLAALVIFLLLPQARRLPNWRIALVLPAYFGATALFVVANTMTTAANAIFLQSAAPLWVVLLGPLLLAERPTRTDLVVLLGVGAGMTMFFIAPEADAPTAPNPRLGDRIAIASGLSYALLMLGVRWLSRSGRGEEYALVAWGNLFTAPVAFALMPAVGQEPIAGTRTDWIVIAVLGVFQVGLAYALLVRGLAGVPAVRASLVMMIEPALSTLLAWIVHAEVPHPLAALGGGLILGSVVANIWIAPNPRPVVPDT